MSIFYKSKKKQLLLLAFYMLFSLLIIGGRAIEVVDEEEDNNLQSCYLQNPQLDCPPNSVCIRINATNPEDLKCICLEHFQYNPKWQEDGDVEEDEIQHKSTVAATTSQDNYCIPTGPEREDEAVEHKVVVYMRSATNPQHLVFGILMILLGVTLVTAVLYGITALRPIKRTKAVYKKLKNRRQNITPLHEMDELEMNRRFEMQTF